MLWNLALARETQSVYNPIISKGGRTRARITYMTKDMTQGSPARLILGFAFPLLAGMLFQQMYNLVDTMIVGRFLGVTALAGVGATGSINFLVLGFCMGICSGFSIPVARCFGAKEMRRLRQYAANGVMVAGVFSITIAALTVLLCRRILVAMGTPEDCFTEAYQYISVIFAGIPFTVLYNLLSGYLRSLGDSKTPLFFLILSSVLNVVLDLFFIINLHLGVMGAALATVISQGVSGLLCLAYVARKVTILHISGDEWQIRPGDIAELCRCGVPMGLQYSITAIGTVVMQVAVNSLGAVAVAANTAGGRVLGFLASPFDALGSTMATYAAQNVGARRCDRLNRGIFSASLMGFVYSGVAYLISLFAGPVLVGLFISGEGGGQLLEMAHLYMMRNTQFYPWLALVNIVRFMIQGMGFSVLAIVAGVMEMVARSLTGIWLVPLFGYEGAVLANPLAWIAADMFLIPAYFICRRILMGEGILVLLRKKQEIIPEKKKFVREREKMQKTS